MKKKLFSSLVILAAATTLVACGASKSDTKKSNATENSSTVKKSSTSSNKAAKELAPSTVTYLTDAEIEAMQTVGDYKSAFQSLMDSYSKDFDELIAQLPEEAQQVLLPTRDQLKDMMAQQQQALTDQFNAAGATDDTAIPAEGRDAMVSAMKMTRDQFQKAMELARQQAQTALDAAE